MAEEQRLMKRTQKRAGQLVTVEDVVPARFVPMVGQKGLKEGS